MTSIAAPHGTLHSPDDLVANAVQRDRAWHAYAVVLGAVCVMIGVYWDISWHMTIGRDTFWTPAHVLIQAGGLISGLSSGFVVLKSTIAPSERDVATAVRVWGFRGPLGAWLCIWGCFAMLASAPFDNWWHDAYGLDVKIVSPPHTILALGIFAIVNGALMLTLARQNRGDGKDRDRFSMLYIIAGGMFVMNFGIFLTEYSLRFLQHGAEFYRMSAIFYPFALIAVARGSKVAWPATATAAVYMGMMLVLMWVIQLFPATPKLGPIYQPITHMVAMAWPLWLIVPALGIDYVRRRMPRQAPMPIEAAALGATFSVLFLLVQWPWAWFMVRSTWSRNRFFNADNFVYWAAPAYVARAHQFYSGGDAVGETVIATLTIAALSSWMGLAWGSWMTRVRR